MREESRGMKAMIEERGEREEKEESEERGEIREKR